MGEPRSISYVATGHCAGAKTSAHPDNHWLMTAPEQMYFLGAPLAHVVQYLEHRRAMRRTSVPGRGSVQPDIRRQLGRS